MELPQPLADNGTQVSSNQPQPKVVQSPCDHSIKKDPDVQVIPPRVVEEQKSSRDGRIKRVMCYKCGEKGHYANSYPTKHKKTRSHDLGLYCLKCGEDGHLASWCPNSPALGQTSSDGPLARMDDQDISAR